MLGGTRLSIQAGVSREVPAGVWPSPAGEAVWDENVQARNELMTKNNGISRVILDGFSRITN
jgi:hypothetical protein